MSSEVVVVVFQLLSHVRLFATPWTAARQASLSFTISWSLLRLMSIESVMPSNHLILCYTFSFCPQTFPASGSFPMSQFFISGGHDSGIICISSAYLRYKHLHEMVINMGSKGIRNEHAGRKTMSPVKKIS